jgi:hypothetical protein
VADRRRFAGPKDERALAAVVAISLAMAARDLRLAARGGGITPRWLLALETVSFGTAAVAGAVGLAPPGDQHRRPAAVRAATIAAEVAAVTHLARLIIYLRRCPR